MREYKGSCHCGAIAFTFTGPEIGDGLRCNCSICRRKGATMTRFTVAPTDMKIDVKGDALATYEFHDRVAKHHFCRNCGIFPFHQTKRKPGQYRINIGCLDDIDAVSLPFEVYDGVSMK